MRRVGASPGSGRRPLRPGRVLRRARALREAGELESAAVLLRRALRRHPEHALLWHVAAQVEADAGRHAEAASHLGRALEASRRPRARWSEQRARLLVAGGAAAADVDAAYWSALSTEGAAEGRVLRSWTRALQQRGVDDERALDVLQAHQLTHPMPVPLVMDRLLSADATGRRRDVLGGHLQRFRVSPEAEACRAVWDAVSRLRPPPREESGVVLALAAPVVRLFFLVEPMDVVVLDDLLGADPDRVRASGLDPASVRSYAEDLRSGDPLEEPDRRDFGTEELRRWVLERERFLGFQTRALRDRRLRLADPHTGRRVVPFDTTAPHGRMLYSFGDRELTVLVTAGEGAVAAALLLVRQGILLDLGTDLQRFLSPAAIAGLLRHLLARAAREPDRSVSAATTARAARPARRISVMVGSAENFALHLWTYFSGLERIVDRRLAGLVDEVHVAGSEFFGPVQTLFPELGPARLVRDAPGRRDPHPFAPDRLVVRPGGYVVTRSLRARVLAAMRRIPPAVEGVAEPTGEEGFPVVWVGLRVGSRSWLDQHRRLPEVMDGIWSRWPDAVFLLDGYSYPVGADLISDRWRADIERLHDLATRIRSASGRPESVVDLVGNTLRESVLWALRSDTYLAPVGTTQHKVGWFCEGRGVTYGPPSLGGVPVAQRPGAREAEGVPMPVYLLGRDVQSGARRRRGDRREHLDNVELDVPTVVEALSGLVEERRAPRVR